MGFEPITEEEIGVARNSLDEHLTKTSELTTYIKKLYEEDSETAAAEQSNTMKEVLDYIAKGKESTPPEILTKDPKMKEFVDEVFKTQDEQAEIINEFFAKRGIKTKISGKDSVEENFPTDKDDPNYKNTEAIELMIREIYDRMNLKGPKEIGGGTEEMPSQEVQKLQEKIDELQKSITSNVARGKTGWQKAKNTIRGLYIVLKLLAFVYTVSGLLNHLAEELTGCFCITSGSEISAHDKMEGVGKIVCRKLADQGDLNSDSVAKLRTACLFDEGCPDEKLKWKDGKYQETRDGRTSWLLADPKLGCEVNYNKKCKSLTVQYEYYYQHYTPMSAIIPLLDGLTDYAKKGVDAFDKVLDLIVKYGGSIAIFIVTIMILTMASRTLRDVKSISSGF